MDFNQKLLPVSMLQWPIISDSATYKCIMYIRMYNFTIIDKTKLHVVYSCHKTHKYKCEERVHTFYLKLYLRKIVTGIGIKGNVGGVEVKKRWEGRGEETLEE